MKNKYNPGFSNEAASQNSENIDEYTQVGCLRRISSSKNIHELRKFNFMTKPAKVEKLGREEIIHKLERQKRQLMKSLQILKNGAVSAILEKDETIEKLRKLFQESSGTETEDSHVQELENLLQYIKDLEDDRQQLRQELQIQRRQFQHEINERENYIRELLHDLDWSNDRIENLEKYDELLQQKIRVMEEANQNLSVLLNKSQASSANPIRKVSSIENIQQEDYFSKSLDAGIRRSDNHELFDHSSTGGQNLSLNYEILNSRDDSLAESRIKDLRQQHQLELQELAEFYEKRIESLKKICISDSESIPRRLQINTQSNEDESIAVMDVPEDKSHKTMETKNKGKDYEKILRKNLSLGSFKSGRSTIKMEPIDEQDEIVTPCRSLKRQLMSVSQLSKKSSESCSLDDEIDKSSQHSYRYYEYPDANFAKKKSFEKGKGSEKGSFPWDKLIFFTLGTITGGSIFSLGNKIFRS